MHWRVFCLLKAISEIFLTEEEKQHNNFSSSNKSKSNSLGSSGKPNFPKKINLNNKWIKVALLTVAATSFYFIFFYGGSYKKILVKKICNENNSVKVTDLNSNEYTISNFISNSTYSKKESHNGNSTVHRIFATSNKGKISFNVDQTIGAQGKKFFKFDDNCKWCDGTCTPGATTCTNCCSSCASSSSSSTACNGCCSNTGVTSDCCSIAKFVNFALLHPEDPTPNPITSLFWSLLPTIFSVFLFAYLSKYIMKQQIGLGGKDSIFQIGKSLSNAVKTNILFDDVAGLTEEKEELKEIVDYLKNPHVHKSMGARSPKGVMLYGPPGTGKTLLAKAVSGEANVPFLEVSGASFDDMFVGMGAKRIRELFQKAKKLSPCIIFIDEIDALASKRSQKNIVGGGGDQTINQFLSELDGFNTNAGIIVIAATNRLESLDEAVLRPGRFDRHIMVNLPELLERADILRVHARNKNISVDVDLNDIARKTPGFSGAQLENVLNEAALMAVRNKKICIGMEEIDEGIDRIMAGPAKKTRKISEAERQQIAYHEAGHAIAGLYVCDGDVVEKITIIPRGKAAGYMLTAPEKAEVYIKTKEQLIASLVCLLAGRASEEIFFGEQKVGTGASNDLYRATQIARDMITKFGMSKNVGLVQHKSTEYDENPYKNSYSESTGILIDEEIKNLIHEQYEKAKETINENREELLLIVETLLLVETIDRKDIYYIHENKKLPENAIKIKEEQLWKKNQKDKWSS